MNSHFQENQNQKAVCLPNGSFYEPIYIDFHRSIDNLSPEPQHNSINDVSELLADYDTNRNDNSKSAIIHSSTDDESTAVEALRQLGNISLCPKDEVESLLICSNCYTTLQVADLHAHALVCQHYNIKCQSCLLTLPYEKYEEHLPCSDEFTFPVLNSTWSEYELVDENFTEVAQEMIIHTSSNGDTKEPVNVAKPPNDTKTNICTQCNKSFKREKALLSHLKFHSDNPNVSCTNCDESFVTKEALAKHVVQCNNLKNSNVLKTVQKHVCSHCEKSFSTKQKLFRHLWIHRKKILSCEVCARCFEEQGDLDAHRLTEHQSSSSYFCGECGKCFLSRQGLWEHNRIHGRINNPYKCDECLKEFSSRQGFLIHKRTHNDERPYGCRFCWKAFRDGSTLRKHERVHTGVRPHVCPLCSKAFNQKVVLREHIRWVHISNWKPNDNQSFACSLCDVTVTEKDYLCSHIVKHSDDLIVAAKNKQNNRGIKIEADESEVYKCDLCNEQYPNKKLLTEHVQMHI